MSRSAPRVSVVVPFLNAEMFLEQTIRSVLAQTYRQWELLLVDDGSTEGSTQIARDYQRRFPDTIHYLEHPGHENRGTCAARNLGIRHARGELIAPLDADDLWLPEKLDRQVALLDSHPEASLIYGTPLYWSSWQSATSGPGADYVSSYGLPLNEVIRPPIVLLQSYPLWPGMGAAFPSDLLFRRRMLDETGLFEESFTGIYQLYEDQAFLAKVYLSQAVYVADECWTWYRLNTPNSCMTKVQPDDEYHTVRLHYLDWLEAYLTAHRLQDPRVWKALRGAKAPYRHFTRSATKHADAQDFHAGLVRNSDGEQP